MTSPEPTSAGRTSAVDPQKSKIHDFEYEITLPQLHHGTIHQSADDGPPIPFEQRTTRLHSRQNAVHRKPPGITYNTYSVGRIDGGVYRAGNLESTTSSAFLPPLWDILLQYWNRLIPKQRQTIQSPEPRTSSPEPAVQHPEPTIPSPEPTFQSPEPTGQTPEPTINSPKSTFKLTAWRLLNTLIVTIFGLTKGVLAYCGQPAVNGFDLALGVVWTVMYALVLLASSPSC